MNLETKFNHILTEKNKYNEWLKKDLFTANLKTDKKPYSIILPPPNVTGMLHLGHAWDVTLQDILIRYKHMNNYETMWIAGMDHAGIATQAKVMARLTESGVDTEKLTREEFLNHAWSWKDEYASVIREQWAKMGIALDYKQEKFTLDSDVNKSVNKVFVELYNEGIIYQGNRITNWDPVAKTALSDIEVIHKEIEGKFYHFKYMLEGSETEYLEVATTRPETIFADGAVAVNPEDERYKKFVGKYVINPADKRKLLVITDEIARMDFGSGAVKISGAHDPNDFEVCQRHPELSKPIIMNLDGTLNELALEFNGIDRFVVREKLVEKLKDEDLVIKIEDHTHSVGHSERTDAVVEPIITKQWYVKMNSLAKLAIENQKTDNKVSFFPQRFESTFSRWMEDVQDWCISRQLWWGHQIPVWYHKKTNEIYCSDTPPSDIENYTQDEDVLDTWFSSALWPFSTTIWADKDNDIEKFFPTDVLVTGYDIIFFWVSRMIFQSLKFTEKRPFEKTLIHGLIRDEDGRKMSKSLGNGVNPMDVIDKYGADSLRYFLSTNSSPGQDMRYSETKLEASWNFINKIWNISRFVLLNIEDVNETTLKEVQKDFDSADYYILSKLNDTITSIDELMEKFEFGEVSRAITHFAKDDFASWYVEVSKININGNDENLKIKQKVVLRHCLTAIVKMLHPFMPFVTDLIYKELSDEEIFNSSWPTAIKDINTKNNDEFKDVIEIVTALRNLRAESDIKSKKMLDISLDINTKLNNTMEESIKSLAKVEKINYNKQYDSSISIVLKNLTLHVNSEGLVDVDEQIEKLDIQLKKLSNEINRSVNMLSNEKFVNNANEEKIKAEKDKANTYLSQYSEIVELYKTYNVEIKKDEFVEKLETIVEEI